jgi:hypothetical protein
LILLIFVVFNAISFSLSTRLKKDKNRNTGENQPSVKLWRADKSEDFQRNLDLPAVATIENVTMSREY